MMLDHFIQWLTPAVEHFRMAGYWIAFAAALAETVLGVGLLLPGSTIILLLGALAARGSLDVGDLILFAFVGAVAGDNINYFLGKKYGSRWAKEGFWFLRQEHFEKARTFFDKHGAASVMWGRLIPSVKEVVPFIAGMVQMRMRTFFIWNVLGAVLWAFEWVLGGYLFAQSLYLARVWMSRLGFFAAVLIAAGVLLMVIRRSLVKHGRQTLAIVRSVGSSIKGAVLNNSEVSKMVGRHERFFDFLRRRLDTATFRGLPLTLLLAAFLYVLILFGGIVEDLVTGDPIVAVDLHVANLVPVFRTPGIVRIFLWLTMLGKWQVILVFSLSLLAALWIWKERYMIVPFLATIIGSQLFVYLGKMAFHRPRPVMAVYTESSFSFPSGHAAVSVAFYGFLAYVLICRTAVWKKKINYMFAGILFSLLIGFSRIYLGVHYLSDVWGGYLIGSLWLIIGITLSQHWKSVHPGGPADEESRLRRVVPALAVAAVVFYVGFVVVYLPGMSYSSVSKSRETKVGAPGEIFRDNNLKYTESVTGNKQQPVNVIFVAEDIRQLARILGQAKWQPADTIGPGSILRTVGVKLSGADYPSAPVIPSFWNDRINDFAFRRIADSPEKKVSHVLYLWKSFFQWKDGRSVFIGQVSLSSDLLRELIRRISLNVDGEREFLLQSLKGSEEMTESSRIDLAGPVSGRNVTGDTFVTDGKAAMVFLKPGDASGRE